MEEGYFGIEYGKDGEISRLVPRIADAYLSTFLLSPDGSKIAWNVNVISGLSSEDAGTSRQQHIIYRADIDGKNRKLVLKQNYDVTGIFADATEDRRLFRWSRTNPEWIYFTRFEGKQLGVVHVGLYRCNIQTGSLEVVDDTIEEVLALSEDETLAAYTPNEGSCCGGINQTNNQVIVSRLRRMGGVRQQTTGTGRGRGWGRNHARSRLLFPRRQAACHHCPPMVIVKQRSVPGHDDSPEDRIRRAWWVQGRAMCRASNVEKRFLGALYLYDVEKQIITLLPVNEIFPLGVDQ